MPPSAGINTKDLFSLSRPSLAALRQAPVPPNAMPVAPVSGSDTVYNLTQLNGYGVIVLSSEGVQAFWAGYIYNQGPVEVQVFGQSWYTLQSQLLAKIKPGQLVRIQNAPLQQLLLKYTTIGTAAAGTGPATIYQNGNKVGVPPTVVWSFNGFVVVNGDWLSALQSQLIEVQNVQNVGIFVGSYMGYLTAAGANGITGTYIPTRPPAAWKVTATASAAANLSYVKTNSGYASSPAAQTIQFLAIATAGIEYTAYIYVEFGDSIVFQSSAAVTLNMIVVEVDASAF